MLALSCGIDPPSASLYADSVGYVRAKGCDYNHCGHNHCGDSHKDHRNVYIEK